MMSTGIDTWQVAGLSDVMGFEMSTEKQTPRVTVYFAYSLHVLGNIENEILKKCLQNLD